MITHLPRVVPEPGPRPQGAGPDHPMRRVTRQVAADPSSWNPATAADVTGLFDGLADEWHTRSAEPRLAPLADAFERGGPVDAGRWLEVGSGTGLVTPWLARRAALVVALDLSTRMLERAGPDGARVRGDAARLPLASGSVDVVVALNAFLFADEVRRVLRPSGALVWVNTSGPGTPIHLPADEVAAAMGPGWSGTDSEAAWGTWAVLRRVPVGVVGTGAGA